MVRVRKFNFIRIRGYRTFLSLLVHGMVFSMGILKARRKKSQGICAQRNCRESFSLLRSAQSSYHAISAAQQGFAMALLSCLRETVRPLAAVGCEVEPGFFERGGVSLPQSLACLPGCLRDRC